MSADQDVSGDDNACPNCGAGVVYRGVGRRPIWCSTRCRNDASLKRLGARRGGVEVRVVEVLRQRASVDENSSGPTTHSFNRESEPDPTSKTRPPKPTLEQALRTLRNDPESVGRLLSHLERRRAEGTLAQPEWLPVRNALRLIAGALPPGIERPT